MDEQLIKALIEETKGGDEPAVRIALMALILVVLALRWYLEFRAKRSAPPSCRYAEPPAPPDLTPIVSAAADAARQRDRIYERLQEIREELKSLELSHARIVDKVDVVNERTIELKGYLRRQATGGGS